MGKVYRAYDSQLGHEVALKAISFLHGSDLYYLKQEFRSLADIRHPNLIDLYELHAGSDASCFFTMELVPGRDFVAHVRQEDERGAMRCDFARLREAAAQLASALIAVHEAGKLHRDIKPSNVLVTPSGRVVLLDFGLVAPIRAGGLADGEGSLIGTPAYMPPEQVRGEPLTTAADWFSFGVTLFESATGVLPPRKPYDWLSGRGSARDARISAFAPDAPEDVDELVASLLRLDPSERATADDVLRVLIPGVTTIRPSRPAPSEIQARPSFEGRTGEMDRLKEALQRVRGGQTTTVHVHGTSGVGKTALLRRFTEDAARQGAVVLTGRCHPQESLPFNALDGMVDALSDVLASASPELLDRWLPDDAGALPRLFPVLARIGAIALAPKDAEVEPGHGALRRVTRALKKLLAAIAETHPLIVWLDDLQWGDEDSGKLVRELVSPPDAPTLLLVLSYRSEDRRSSRALTALDSFSPDSSVDVPLSPLSSGETAALILNLLPQGVTPQKEEFEALIDEAGGLPFFAREIAHYLAESSVTERLPAKLNLDDLLKARVSAQSATARRLLELVAVAGSPIEHHFLLRAAGLDDGSRQVLAELERANLVRSATLSPERRTEIYHHRIRDALMALLGDDDTRSHHKNIALAMLGAARPSLPQVVEHFEAAREPDLVRRYVVPAARQADGALAFDRAAQLYRRAIDLGCTDLDPSLLYEHLGEALANAGLGREAGATFERAANLAESSPHDEEHLLSLRRRAAEQYLKSWQRADAMRALDAVLPILDIRVPRGMLGAFLQTAANRALIALFHSEDRPSRAGPAAPKARNRLEILKTLMLVYGNTEPMIGFAFGSRLFLEALEARDPDFVFRAMSYETTAWVVMPGAFAQRQADRHRARLTGLRRTTEDPGLLSSYYLALAYTEQFRGNFSLALEFLESSLAEHPKMRGRATVDYANTLAFYLPALGFLGQLQKQRKILDVEVADAQARGDNYLLATCAAGHSSLGWIVSGREAEARAWSHKVLAVASPGFSTQHYCFVMGRVYADLYLGRGEEAALLVEELWPAIRKNRYLDIALIGDDLRQTRARAALGRAAARGGKGAVASSACKIVLDEAKVIEAHGLPFASGWAHLLRAGVAAVSGDGLACERALEGAIPVLERCGLSFYAASAKYALGRRQTRAREYAAAGERWLIEAGSVDPRATARMLVPGCID